jgi:hypothetical protein
MRAHTTDGSFSHGPGGLFENFAYDATTPSLEEKAQSFGFPAIPADIPSTALVDPSFTPPTNALTQNLSAFSPHSFSSSYSSLSSSSYTSSSSSLGSSHLNYLDQESVNYPISGTPPDGLGTFGGSLATSPGPDARVPITEAMDVKSGQYSAIHPGSLIHHPVLKRQRQSYNNQIGTFDRRFTCTVCGQSFAGEYERTRHFNSVHLLPTIGCRACNYKQSRVDLFREHCKKRHPGRSTEELVVHLVHRADSMYQ